MNEITDFKIIIDIKLQCQNCSYEWVPEKECFSLPFCRNCGAAFYKNIRLEDYFREIPRGVQL